MELLLIIFSF